MAAQFADDVLRAEVLADVSETAMGVKLVPIVGHHAGSLLAPVLEGV